MLDISTVCFANLATDVKTLVQHNCTENVICLADSAIGKIRSINLPYRTYKDYLSSDDYLIINSASHDMMKSWQNYDFSQFPEGKMSDYFINLHSMLTGMIRKLYLCDLVLSRDKPRSVCVTNSSVTLAASLSLLCSSRNTTLNVLSTGYFGCLSDILKDYASGGQLYDGFKAVIGQIRTAGVGVEALDLLNQIGDLPNPLSKLMLKDSISLLSKWLSVRKFKPSSEVPHSKSFDVLSLCPNVNAVTTVGPVLKYLERTYGKTSICITMYPSASDKCEEIGLKHANISNFPPDVSLSNWRSYRLSNWNKLKIDNQFRSKFQFRDCNIFNFVEPSLQIIFSAGFPYVSKLMQSLSSALSTYSPKIILLPEDTGLATRPMVRVAEKRGTKSLTIQHGTIEEPTLYCESISDKMAVWGKHSLDLLSNYGVRHEKLAITGMARLDMLSQFSDTVKAMIFKDLGLDSQKKLFIWTPSPYIRTSSHESRFINEDLLLAIEAVFSQSISAQLVIKIHPLDDPSRYRHAKFGMVTQDIDTLQLLYSCDALLVSSSTTGVEAIAFGKPLIYLNFHNIPETVPYAQYGAAIRVSNISELKSAVAVISDQEIAKKLEEGRKDFISKYLLSLDGRASERIAGILMDMAT